jgi:hypothetical protein
MPCPHLKEVVMLYCAAAPIRKMVPLDRLASVDPCFAPDYPRCPFFPTCAAARDALERGAPSAPPARKEALR